MALKLPKMPKMKRPKMPKLRGPKLPTLKGPKLPKMPTKAGIAAGVASGLQGINIGYIVASLFLIPIIIISIVISNVGLFGAGTGIGILNILGLLISLGGALMTAISASMGPIGYLTYFLLIIAILFSSATLLLSKKTPKEEKEA